MVNEEETMFDNPPPTFSVAKEFEFKPSAYQTAILNFVTKESGSAIVEAVAGSGKTTTIVESMNSLPYGARALCLAFNKNIADALITKVRRDLPVRTTHSFGYKCWKNSPHCKPHKINKNKVPNLADAYLLKIVKNNPEAHPKLYHLLKKLYAVAYTAARLVANLKIKAILPPSLVDSNNPKHDNNQALWDGFWEDLLLSPLILPRWFVEHFPGQSHEAVKREYVEIFKEFSEKLLHASILNVHELDFEDMLYMVHAYSVPVNKYDYLFVDEAQDLNDLQRVLINSALTEKGKLIAFGDRRQAIYGWRGANHKALDLLETDFSCKKLPLSISYRCPRYVVTLAKHYAPQIEAKPGAKKGLISIASHLNVDHLQPEDRVLSRYNSTLIRLFFNLVANGRPVRIMSRPIEETIHEILQALPDDMSNFEANLQKYCDKMKDTMIRQGRGQQALFYSDMHNCISFLYHRLHAPKTKTDLESKIANFFSNAETKNGILLSTIHGVKGLEAERIYILGANILGGNFTHEGLRIISDEEDQNIAYVAITRALAELHLIWDHEFGPNYPEAAEGSVIDIARNTEGIILRDPKR
jgi:DNA helicase II / ATP-dependent DNA helicase PcrA